jgi:hypothetical protein
MIKEYRTNDIVKMKPGNELDQLVHKLADNGHKAFWLHIPDYSTYILDTMELVDDLKEQCKFFNIYSTADGYNVEFNKTIVNSKTLPEAICKAFIIGSMQISFD